MPWKVGSQDICRKFNNRDIILSLECIQPLLLKYVEEFCLYAKNLKMQNNFERTLFSNVIVDEISVFFDRIFHPLHQSKEHSIIKSLQKVNCCYYLGKWK